MVPYCDVDYLVQQLFSSLIKKISSPLELQIWEKTVRRKSHYFKALPFILINLPTYHRSSSFHFQLPFDLSTWYLFFCSQPVITSQSSIFCWTCNRDKSEVHAQAWNVSIVAKKENFRQDIGMRKKVIAPGYDQDCSVDQDHPHSSVSSETDDYLWLKICDPVCILPPSCHPPLWTGRLLVDSWSPWLSL